MIRFLIGLNKDARGQIMMDEIKARCDVKQDRMFLLVPEQVSFLMSREICRVVGNDASNGHIEAIGFLRLMERVYKECGQRTEHLDDGGRLLAMAVALNLVKKDLTVFMSSARRAEFVKCLVELFNHFQLHGITGMMLEEAMKKTKSKILSSKLMDLIMIFNKYDEVCSKCKKDPSEIYDSVYQILSSDDWLENTTWFIEGYTSFPQKQMKIIQLILQRALDVTFCISAAGLDDCSLSSHISVMLGEQLVTYCRNHGLRYEIVRTKDESDDHPALALLQKEICNDRPIVPQSEEFSCEAEKMVHVFTDPSIYQECQHVAGAIMRTVRTESPKPYRYRDISVVLCDYDKYAPVFEAVCRRYRIPVYFSTEKAEVTMMPVMLTIFTALLSVTRGLPKSEVLQYMKSGLTNLTLDEVDALERYVLTWNIHGRGWSPEKEWAMHPDGFGFEFSEDDRERLRELNAIREKGVNPLLRLQERIKGSSKAKEYLMALYDFMEEISFTERLQELVDAMAAGKEEQKAMQYGQLAEVLSQAMEQMYSVVGELVMPPSEFVNLFKLLCSAYRIATIPACLDQVQVFSVPDARHQCSRFRYILGAEEGVFPDFNTEGSLLDKAEFEELNSMGLYIPGSIKDIIERNLSDIYAVVAGAKKEIAFSYVSNAISAATPSHLVLRVMQLYPTITPVAGGSAVQGNIYAADTMTADMLGRLAGRITNRRRYEDILLQICGLPQKEVQEATGRILQKALWTMRDLRKATIKDLYGARIPLSATRADVYASCRFHYFLQYGLKLREAGRGKITSPVFGKFAHAVLEKVLKEVESRYGGFEYISRSQLYSLCKEHIDLYTEYQMAGLESQPERYQYLYKRNCREIISVLQNVCDEFQSSDFHCSDFELRVGGEEADIPGIYVPGSKALSGMFVGVTDRVDTCTVEDGRTFFRVIDYKTGKTKAFDMADILLGKSLQLILYQAALIKNGYGAAGGHGGAEPAGVLYVPAKETIVAAPTKLTDEKVLAERDKVSQRRGVLLADRAALNAMEHIEGEKARFLPFKFNKDGTISGDIATAGQLDMLNDFAMAKLQDMVDDIATGCIKANPLSHGMQRTSCQWCPYKAVCHKDMCGVKFKYQASVKTSEFWAQVSDRVAGD